jgi:SAM-dependent methyltransferase
MQPGYTADYAALAVRADLEAPARHAAASLIPWLAEQHSPSEAPPQVLDLACGTGAAALSFAASGYPTVGLDGAAPLLAQAQARAERDHLPARFAHVALHDIATQTRFAPASFSLVTCLNGALNRLTTVADLKCTFASIAALLRPGGRCYCEVHTAAAYPRSEPQTRVLYDGPDALAYQQLQPLSSDTPQTVRRVVWFVRDDIELWWRGETAHNERPWSAAEFARVARAAGFNLLYGAQTASDVPCVPYILEQALAEAQRG